MLSDKRALDKKLKTQLHWGQNDIEVYTKEKCTPDKLKCVNLHDFMEGAHLPEFDNSIKWTARQDLKPKKDLVFGNDKSCLPSLRKNSLSSGLTRQHSDSASSKTVKKMRKDSTLEDEDMDDYDTLAGRSQSELDYEEL